MLVCGDLNNILDYDERVGGRYPLEKEIKEFVDTAAYLSIQDCPSTGCFFTWTNGSIFSRIDRLMFNNAWLEAGWTVKSKFHSRGEYSDHSVCTAELFNPIHRFKRDFKYCNFWNGDPNFRHVLEKSWRTPTRRLEGQQRLTLKLKRLRADLKPLKRKELVNISERAHNARVALDAIQAKVDKDPLNKNLRMEELQARKTCKYLSEAEFSFLTQRAKSIKLNSCDKNTKYFHSIVKSSSARNDISFIHREDNSITGDMNIIIEDFLNYYKLLFGSMAERTRVE